MGVLLSAIALVGLTISLLWYTAELMGKQVEKGREALFRLEKKEIENCKEKLVTYVLSQPLPLTFNIPVEQICGSFFHVERRDCDAWYCTYDILFGKFRENADVVFSLTKSFLLNRIEAENISRLREVAALLLSYQKSFPDHAIVNHFLDVGSTEGYRTLSAYSDFFADAGAVYMDRYAEDTGNFSNFLLCTSDGADCEVKKTPPFECRLRYTSPYTGKTVEIAVSDGQ